MSKTTDMDYGVDLEQIFGAERISGHINGEGKQIKGWKDRYPLLWQSNDVQVWIKAKLFRFMAKGKNPAKFNVGNYVSALMKYIEFAKSFCFQAESNFSKSPFASI